MRIILEVLTLWAADPDVAAWLERSRTNLARMEADPEPLDGQTSRR